MSHSNRRATSISPRRLHACGTGSSVMRPYLFGPETTDCATAVPTAAVILQIVNVVLGVVQAVVEAARVRRGGKGKD